MRIHITGAFCIEANGRNYVVKEEYEGKTRNGDPRKGERFRGSYNDLSCAIRKCLALSTLNGSKAVELWEYAKMIEESNKKAVNSFKKEIELLLREVNK